MSGMVAVVARGRRSSVGPGDIEGLARTYQELRGAAEQTSAVGGDRVRLVRFRTAADGDGGIQRDGPAWAASVGVVHHPGSLVSAPLRELDGTFAVVRYDAHRDEVVIASDPFGMQALYVMERGDRTYVSTSALVLARHLRAAADRLGVFTYLRIGRGFGPSTHWAGIRRLDPATSVRISADTVDTSHYWRAPIDDDTGRLSFQRAVSHCIEALVETLRDRLSGLPGTWSDLTGGFDSRLMALGLSQAGIAFRANTVGPESSEDVRIAARVAATAGWSWQPFSLPSDWHRILPGRLDHAVAWGDGLLDALQLSEVLWHHERKRPVHRLLQVGGGGELFSNKAWRQESLFLRGGRSRQVNWDNWLGMRLMSPVDTSIFAQDRSAELRADLRRRQESWIEPYADRPNTVQLDMLHAYRGTGHFGAYGSAAAAFLETHLPFYFKPVFVAATSSNFRFRNDHRLQRHMIRTLDPRVAAVSTSSGAPAEPYRPANLHRFLPYYIKVGRKVVDKLAQRAVGRTLVARGSPVGRHPPNARLAVLEHLRREGGFGYDDLRIGPLLRRSAFEELVRAAGDRDATMLGRIITAELALRASDGALDG